MWGEYPGFANPLRGHPDFAAENRKADMFRTVISEIIWNFWALTGGGAVSNGKLKSNTNVKISISISKFPMSISERLTREKKTDNKLTRLVLLH